MQGRTRTRWWLALLTALALALAACGGGEGDDEATGGTGETGEDGEPQRGGVLSMAYASDIDNLNPLEMSSFNTHNRIGLVYSRLIGFETGPDLEPSDQVLEPDLAEDWEIAEDGLTYTFNLRDDVVWHDIPPVNGRPFVADDVVATLTAIKERGFQRYMLENVESIEAVDEHTVQINLSEPFAPLLNFMANHHMWILPREAIEGQVDLQNRPIGTGPFVMVNREPNIVTEYERNPNYYQDGKPYLDGIRLLVVPDQQARTAAFRNGELDLIITSSSPEEIDAVRRTNPDAVYREDLQTGYNQIGMNPAREPFDDVRVRKAVSLALDRQGMGDAIYGGGEFATAVAPALGDWALPADERAELMRYDPEEARRLLAEAGLPDGFSTTIMATPAYGEQTLRQTQWFIEDLAQVGIDAQLELVEYATYFGSRWPSVDYDMYLGPQTPFLEPDEWLRAQHMTGAPRNWFGISDPVLDEMLVEQTQVLDREERMELVHDIQRYIATEVVNPIQTWAAALVYPQHTWVKNYHPHNAYGFYELRNVWLDR